MTNSSRPRPRNSRRSFKYWLKNGLANRRVASAVPLDKCMQHGFGAWKSNIPHSTRVEPSQSPKFALLLLT
jgi:hypothetical protein